MFEVPDEVPKQENNFLAVLPPCETIWILVAEQKETGAMQLTNDLSVRKWKPKKDGERVSCGESCYVKGWLNGNRSFVFRAQPRENGVQKTFWITIGRPSAGKGETRLGAELSLSEARMAAMFLRQAITSGDYTVDQVKKVIGTGCAVMELSEALKTADEIKIDPVQQLHRYPTFEECFQKWYDLNIKAIRWTHKDSLKRPQVAYAHVKAQLGHLPINAITRSLVKSVLQDMYMEVTELAGKMRGYCEEIFENALDDRLIDHNPVPPARNFTIPNKKIRHHGTIKAARLPDLYNYIVACNYSASFKACAVALIVSGLRVSNIAMLRQEHYDPATGQFKIPEKSDDNNMLGLMKSGREYTGMFPDGCRQMINDQLVGGHEYVFVSSHDGRCINPESLRKLFKGFDPKMTSHGFRNTFKEWSFRNQVLKFLIDRCTDHALKGLDASYRRFDTLECRAEVVCRYYRFMTTGKTPAPRQQPLLEAVA